VPGKYLFIYRTCIPVSKYVWWPVTRTAVLFVMCVCHDHVMLLQCFCSAPLPWSLLIHAVVQKRCSFSNPDATCTAITVLLDLVMVSLSMNWQQQHLTVSSNQRSSNKQYTVYQHQHYAPYKALVAGIASSLPSLVLRSMLKQRRILMRMH